MLRLGQGCCNWQRECICRSEETREVSRKDTSESSSRRWLDGLRGDGGEHEQSPAGARQGGGRSRGRSRGRSGERRHESENLAMQHRAQCPLCAFQLLSSVLLLLIWPTASAPHVRPLPPGPEHGVPGVGGHHQGGLWAVGVAMCISRTWQRRLPSRHAAGRRAGRRGGGTVPASTACARRTHTATAAGWRWRCARPPDSGAWRRPTRYRPTRAATRTGTTSAAGTEGRSVDGPRLGFSRYAVGWWLQAASDQ
eukprot:1191156-Rhodomonas_salina.1